MYYLAKVLISSVLIVTISEVSKRSSFLGGVVASLPLVSLLAILWLYIDTGSTEKVINLSWSITWLVIPSLSLFITLMILLKRGLSFYLSLALSMVVMVLFYFILIYLLKKIGYNI